MKELAFLILIILKIDPHLYQVFLSNDDNLQAIIWLAGWFYSMSTLIGLLYAEVIVCNYSLYKNVSSQSF